VRGVRTDNLNAGDAVGAYRILRKLGIGGTGVVYEAEPASPDGSRRVALKFLTDELAEDADAVRRLRREAEIIGAFNHPHICKVHGVGDHQGRIFIAMESLGGASLKVEIARHGALETWRVAEIADQIASALEAAHAAGIVHRDIKPGNVMLGDAGRVKVLDFGLARRFRTEDAAAMDVLGSTMPGRPIGTANYMAPERILQLPLDPRCDLFSLGVVIYEASTGQLPFAGATAYETVINVLERTPAPLTSAAPGRPRRLERVVDRLLEKETGRRYQSAHELRRALAPLVREARLRRLLSLPGRPRDQAPASKNTGRKDS
jgi:serine/threonine protein kinase